MSMAAIGVLGVGAPGRACSCVGAEVDVAPLGDVAAPLNTHVWVFAPPTLEPNPPAEPRALARVDVELRGPDDRVVATERTDYVLGSLRVVELSPRDALGHSTGYSVLVSLPEEAGRSRRESLPGGAPHHPAGTVRQVGERSWLFTFVTGTSRDDEAPGGSAISWGRLSPARSSRPGMCETGEAEIRLGLNNPITESRLHPRLVAVWLGDRALETGRSPDGFLLVDDVVSLGRPGYCSVRSATVTEGMMVGIARVDLAGNRSGVEFVRFPGERAPSDDLIGEISKR